MSVGYFDSIELFFVVRNTDIVGIEDIDKRDKVQLAGSSDYTLHNMALAIY